MHDTFVAIFVVLVNDEWSAVAHNCCCVYRNRIGLAVLQLLESGELLKLKKKWWLDKGECPVDVDSKVISGHFPVNEILL